MDRRGKLNQYKHQIYISVYTCEPAKPKGQPFWGYLSVNNVTVRRWGQSTEPITCCGRGDVYGRVDRVNPNPPYICLSFYMYTYLYTFTHIYIYMGVCVCIYLSICLSFSMYMNMYMYTHIYICIYLSIYLSTYLYKYIYIYIHIHRG